MKTMMEKINTGRNFKAIINHYIKVNGYKKRCTFVQTSYNNGFAVLGLENKKDNNPKYFKLIARILPEEEQNFSEVELTLQEEIKIGKKSWQSTNYVQKTYYRSIDKTYYTL